MKEVGARSDVYSLGATLYYLLTGQDPYKDDSFLEMLSKIQTVEPVSIRRLNAKVAADIETIVAKAMTKEPARRYASAAEFAADIRRFLSGEPILARPPSIIYRMTRRIRKNPLPYVLGAGAIIASAVALQIWLVSIAESHRMQEEQRQADERLQLERESALEMLRQTASTSLSIALDLRRKGFLEPMSRSKELLENAYQRAVQRSADKAEVHYLMGRMHRALMQDEKALEYQEKALAKDPRYPPALYERAVLNVKQYIRRCREAFEELRAQETTPRSGSVRIHAPTLEDAERLNPKLAQWRSAIVADLEALGKATEKSDWITPANVLAAEGILLTVGAHAGEAQKKLLEAVKIDPNLEEAWEALGQLALNNAEYARAKEDREHWFEKAVQWLSEGHEHDQGYVPLLLARADALIQRARARIQYGGELSADYKDAEADLTEVLRLDSNNAGAYARRGLVRANRAYYLPSPNQDPLTEFAAAESDLSKSLDLDPGNWTTWLLRGGMRVNRANYLSTRGKDPFPDVAAAEKDLAEAGKLRPLNAEIWTKRGVLAQNRGLYRYVRGNNPLADYDAAEKCYSEALRLNPLQIDAWIYRAGTRVNRGVVCRGRGGDPRPDYQQADQDYLQALKIDPDNADAHMRRATLHTNAALYLMQINGDVAAEVQVALQELDRAAALNPKTSDVFYRRAAARGNLATWKLQKNQDPMDDYRICLEDLNRSLELNASSANVYKLRGEVHFDAAQYLEKRLQQPDKAQEEYRHALEDFTQAIKINPMLDSQVRDHIKVAQEKLGDY
jgi:tetratricopeptide (TPR) repeat protein